MGTKLAPSYANIFMGDFEEKHVYTYPHQPLWWKRFIDDIIMIWTVGLEKLNEFIQHLNSCHQTIKFTATISDNQVPFLDTILTKTQDGTLHTDLYTKPTNSHSYLHYTSCHPRHIKTSLPLSQYLRIKRICSNPKDFDHHSGDMTQHFLKRGYPIEVLTEALLKANQFTRDQLLNKTRQTETDQKNLYPISTFHPSGNILKQAISRNWHLLNRSCSTRGLTEHKLVFGHRRNKNLKDILVKAKINYNPDDPEGPSPHLCDTDNTCKTKKCRYCPLLDKSGKITSNISNEQFTTRKNITCKSHNIIYCITCTNCGIQYVEQTKRRLMDRLQGHLYNVSKGIEQIGRHYTSPNHQGTGDMKIHILSFISQASESPSAIKARDTIELRWINRLRTQAPFGLNISD